MFYCNFPHYPGGKWGVLGLREAEMDISQVSVQHCCAGGIDFRDGAVASISSSSIKNCRIGIQLEEGAKVGHRVYFCVVYNYIILHHLHGFYHVTSLLYRSMGNLNNNVTFLRILLGRKQIKKGKFERGIS